MAIDILNSKVTEANGLLSKIQIGGKVYEIKDLLARQNIGTLSTNIEKVASDLAALSYVKATGVFADDAAVKSYVDAQVGSINKFDVRVLSAGENLPTASASTMYVLYLKPDANAEADAFVEYITVRSGEEGAYTYRWEAIGSTKMDVSGLVTEEELATELAKYTKTEEFGDLAFKDEADLDLKALAHKDSAKGTVAGEVISGVKATGTSTGSINVELEQSEHAMNSTGKYTPVGGVSGSVTVASHQVPVALSHTSESAALEKGDYTPAGDVSVSLSGASFNKITGVGTQASFQEGAFTPAELKTKDITIAAHNHLEAAIDQNDNECLVFTAPMIEALTFKAVDTFSGGSKASDTFVANSLPTMEAHNVGVASSTFTGTKAEKLVVTSVSYDKAVDGTGTCAGGTYDIDATFTGSEGDISVAGTCHDYAVKTAEFNGAAIELAVGDITVAAKEVTVQ